jgi:hypothetical protein
MLEEGGAEEGAGSGLLLVEGSSAGETSSLNRPACDAAITEEGGGAAAWIEASQEGEGTGPAAERNIVADFAILVKRANDFVGPGRPKLGFVVALGRHSRFGPCLVRVCSVCASRTVVEKASNVPLKPLKEKRGRVTGTLLTYGDLVTTFTSSKRPSLTNFPALGGRCRPPWASPKASLGRSIGSSDGRCVQRAGT